MNYHRNWSDTALTTWNQAASISGDNEVTTLRNGSNTTVSNSLKTMSNSSGLYTPTLSLSGQAYGPPLHGYSHTASTHSLPPTAQCIMPVVQTNTSGGGATSLYQPQPGPYPLAPFSTSLVSHPFAPPPSRPGFPPPPSAPTTQPPPPTAPSQISTTRLGQQASGPRGVPGTTGPIPLFPSSNSSGSENISSSGIAGGAPIPSGGRTAMVASFFTPPLASQSYYPSHSGTYQPQAHYYLYPTASVTMAGNVQTPQASTFYSYPFYNQPVASAAGAPMLRVPNPYSQAPPPHIQGLGQAGAQQQHDVHTAALNLLNSVLSSRYAGHRGQNKQHHSGIKGSITIPGTTNPRPTNVSKNGSSVMPLLSDTVLKQMDEVTLEDKGNTETETNSPTEANLLKREDFEVQYQTCVQVEPVIANNSADISSAFGDTPSMDSVSSAVTGSNAEEGGEEMPVLDVSCNISSSAMSSPFPNQSIRILPRPKVHNSPRKSPANKEINDSVTKEDNSAVKPSLMTLQEREANYAAARLRILGSAYPEESSDTDETKETSKVITPEESPVVAPSLFTASK